MFGNEQNNVTIPLESIFSGIVEQGPEDTESHARLSGLKCQLLHCPIWDLWQVISFFAPQFPVKWSCSITWIHIDKFLRTVMGTWEVPCKCSYLYFLGWGKTSKQVKIKQGKGIESVCLGTGCVAWIWKWVLYFWKTWSISIGKWTLNILVSRWHVWWF